MGLVSFIRKITKEPKAADVFEPINHPFIFILGAPRSGTTLIYEAITLAFDIAYPANLHDKFYHNPAIASQIRKIIKPKRKASFQSNYGHINDLFAPSEMGRFWHRFFGKDSSPINVTDIDQNTMCHMRGSLQNLIDVEGKPIIFKTLPLFGRIDIIKKLCPQAVFIIIKRDKADNAHAILRARKKVNGNYEDWWSMEVSAYQDLLNLSPEKQVISQIDMIYEKIDMSLKTDETKTYILNYEDFCGDPKKTLNDISIFLSSNGVSANLDSNSIADKFTIRKRAVPEFQMQIKTLLENK